MIPGYTIRRNTLESIGINIIPLALAAGLIVPAEEGYIFTDKAYALGKELGVDREEIMRKRCK